MYFLGGEGGGPAAGRLGFFSFFTASKGFDKRKNGSKETKKLEDKSTKRGESDSSRPLASLRWLLPPSGSHHEMLGGANGIETVLLCVL